MFKKSLKQSSIKRLIHKKKEDMNIEAFNIVAILLGGVAGGGISFVLSKKRGQIDLEKNKKNTENILNKAKKEAEEIKGNTNVNVQKRKEDLKQKIEKNK